MSEKRHCDRCDVILPRNETDVCQRNIEGDDKKLGAFSLRVFVYHGKGHGTHLDLCETCHRELRSHRGIA